MGDERSSGGAPELHLDDLPIDGFEIDGTSFTVESLTDGHGMSETGASCFFSLCICSCSES